MKEVHLEFRRYNPMGWSQPKPFRMYQLTRIESFKNGDMLVKRETDLFDHQHVVKLYRLRRRYRKEEKKSTTTWQKLVNELEETK